MTDRIYSFLGLATKAGKLISGDDTCEKALKAGKAKLVIISGDASHNTQKKFSDMCSYRNVELRVYGVKDELGKYIGKGTRSVVAILDREFSNRLIEMIDNKEYGGERIGKI